MVLMNGNPLTELTQSRAWLLLNAWYNYIMLFCKEKCSKFLLWQATHEQYESVQATKTSDRLCGNATKCGPGYCFIIICSKKVNHIHVNRFYASTLLTDVNNRECTPCRSGTFLPYEDNSFRTSCLPVTTCEANQYIKVWTKIFSISVHNRLIFVGQGHYIVWQHLRRCNQLFDNICPHYNVSSRLPTVQLESEYFDHYLSQEIEFVQVVRMDGIK